MAEQVVLFFFKKRFRKVKILLKSHKAKFRYIDESIPYIFRPIPYKNSSKGFFSPRQKPFSLPYYPIPPAKRPSPP